MNPRTRGPQNSESLNSGDKNLFRSGEMKTSEIQTGRGKPEP